MIYRAQVDNVFEINLNNELLYIKFNEELKLTANTNIVILINNYYLQVNK